MICLKSTNANTTLMDIKTIFGLLGHLTSQTSIKDLTLALSELMVANFSGVHVIVYEVQGGRTEDSKRNCIVGLDCLQMSPSVYLHEESQYLEAYQSKEELGWSDQSGLKHLVIPVELYDRTISHLIVASHPYKEGNALDLLQGLLRIFTDIFRNIHEKGYDPLTRILNRQAYDQIVTNIAYSSKKSQLIKGVTKSFSTIAILDIDHFKTINDQYGHAIGDETLVLFAQTIRSILRQEDLFFRYGGEEFVIFVKETEPTQNSLIVERCRKAIESRRFPQVGLVTVSIGYANLNTAEHPSDSLSKADKALYYSKQNGRNQAQSYEKLIAQKLLEPLEVQHGSADFW